MDHHLLREEDLLGRDLHAQVTARHHDPVRLAQHLVEVDQALLVLDLKLSQGNCSVRALSTFRNKASWFSIWESHRGSVV